MLLSRTVPALVSALAFGYGFGMVAPEATIAPVRTAVGASRSIATLQPSSPQVALDDIRKPHAPGSESRELGRLRDAVAREGMAPTACMTGAPSFSRFEKRSLASDKARDPIDDLEPGNEDVLSRLQLPDLRLTVTRRTLKYVHFFSRTEKGRRMFETWLKRSGRYQELVRSELRAWRLPDDLLWVAMIESGFDARATSPAGAVGLWQFMPATGEVYGLTRNALLDERKNPAKATRAAAHHLRDLFLRFGNWDLALAAYNMGYEQLLDAVDRYGTTDFAELARQEALPSETAAYVPKIGAAAIVANNLEHFGFDNVDLAPAVDAAEVAVPAGVPLSLVAKAAGIATSTVRGLNPDLLSDRVPPGRGDRLVMVPARTVAQAQAALPAMLGSDRLGLDEESILAPVSVLEGRAMQKKLARQDDDNLLGLLPHYRRRSLRDAPLFEDSGNGVDAPEDDRSAPAADVDQSPTKLLSHRSRRRGETILYRVSQGDTLASLAREFSVPAEAVARQNRIPTTQPLTVGAFLKLRLRRAVVEDLNIGASTGHHHTASKTTGPRHGLREDGAASPARTQRGRSAHE